MKQKEFVDTIRACRRRLNLAEFLKLLVLALAISAGVGILFQAVAFVVPFYYANHYTGAALLLGVLTAFVAACIRRKTMKQTALVMDSFGFRERIITAYEHLKEDGPMVQLQREDAMRRLKEHRERVRISLVPEPKKIVWATGLLLCLFIMMAIPADMKDRARELHRITEEAKEKEKEIEEVVEELEELQQEVLTPEQLAALQEMMESLQSSMAEYQQANSAETLATATEKLNYKYENMSNQLANLAENLQNASISPETAAAMQALAKNVQQMSGGISSGNQSLASNQNQGQNGQNGQSGNGQSGQNNGQNSQNGQSGQNGQNGNQTGQGSNGQGGNGSGQGGNGQSGNGNGQGGNGQGGQGSGSGSGSGGSGGGRGTGSSDAIHDYVSIPNVIADSENLTGNATNHDTSQYFRGQNGLSWEGTHMSHEAIIGSYEQNAYEGIAAGRYPSGMEEVIKEYFAGFN